VLVAAAGAKAEAIRNAPIAERAGDRSIPMLRAVRATLDAATDD
jgi:hypothetical protein